MLTNPWQLYDDLIDLVPDDVSVTLPEELHTGSPREAFCPNSTATSRPAG